MSNRVPIPQSSEFATRRDLLISVVLFFVTFGLYSFYWWFQVNKDLANIGRAMRVDLGTSPVTSLLAMTVGGMIIVPPIMSMLGTSQRLVDAQATTRRPQASKAVLFILFFLLFPIGLWYYQRELNAVIDAL